MKNFELKTNATNASNVKSFNQFKKFEIAKSNQKKVKGGNDIIIEDFGDA